MTQMILKRAVREFCLECVCGAVKAVNECTSLACPLYEFRMGKNPYSNENIKGTIAYRDNLRGRRLLKAKRMDIPPDRIFGLKEGDVEEEEEETDISSEAV